MAQYPWFRLYSEFSTDPKVQSMPEHMQRRLIMLFCLRCSNGDATLQQQDELLLQQELCCALRITPDELAETKELFIKKNFITDAWEVIKWNKRQFQSDHSTPRSQKSRARKRLDSKDENPFQEAPEPPPIEHKLRNGDATLQQRLANGSATPPDTDTDTDTEERCSGLREPVVENRGKGFSPPSPDKTNFSAHDLFESLYKAHPQGARKDRGIAERYFVQSIGAGVDTSEIIRVHGLMCATEEWQWKHGAKAPTLAQWLLDKGWKYPPTGNGNGNGHSDGSFKYERLPGTITPERAKQLREEREARLKE